MKLNAYCDICDDWGWFIDIENNCFNENISLQPYRSVIKKFNSCVNKLPIIQEDEYEYYHKNYKDPEEIIYKECQPTYDINLERSNKSNSNKNSNTNTIFNVCSTTLISSLLAYVIFIVL